MPATKEAKCPRCKIEGRPVNHETRNWWQCPGCGGMFDDEPLEGGSHASGDPARRMERSEEDLKRRMGGRLRRTGHVD